MTKKYTTVSVEQETIDYLRNKYPGKGFNLILKELVDEKCPKPKVDIISPSNMAILKNQFTDDLFPLLKEKVLGDIRESTQYLLNTRLKQFADKLEDRFIAIEEELRP